MNDTLITSSGIIKNRSKPRVGVVSIRSLADWVYDEIDQGIDLTWEEFDDEMNQRIEKGEISLDDAQEEMEDVEFDTKVILLGDWIKVDGKYSIDPNGKEGFAAEYNSGTGTICVEYSKHTKLCNNTSPCYVMADGSGPCGDLDSEGDTVIAYTLPVEFFRDAA